MKIDPISPEDVYTPYNPGTAYPYGTCIKLEGDLADAAGYKSFKAGDVVEIKAFAFVKEKSEEAKGGEIERELELQLTGIELTPAKSDRVKVLYGEGK